MMDLSKYVKGGVLKIIVKTGARRTEILSFDDSKKALRVSVKAQPIDGKANIEIIKFFSKKLKKKVEIKSGKTSKGKFLKIS
ncbi:YggU family protein [Candidatus Woesearchaeota archaeon]|nr:YggU family protein [Candidatus Woesearchaeota archaeon]